MIPTDKPAQELVYCPSCRRVYFGLPYCEGCNSNHSRGVPLIYTIPVNNDNSEPVEDR